MATMSVPAAVRETLGDAASDGLLTMFAEAHRLSTDRFERVVLDLEGRLDRRFLAIDQRFDAIDQRFIAIDQRFIAVDQRFDALEHKMDHGFTDVERKFDVFGERFERRLAEQRFDLLKWSFLFWIGQLAALTAILSAIIPR